MADSKRWTVTYTKHIKQKRKVYQDGFLLLNVSTSKLALYDECEKLLECRLLKSDETVASGESLAFNGHLVDIGSLEGEIKPEPHLNVDRKQKNVSRFRTPDVKMNAKETIARTRKPLSPSQKIIKEFKKRELLKYESPKISHEVPKPSTPEFQVLYTSQMTQKAKKYHDGFLRLVFSGSRGGQVKLFDASRNLLGSRFLKKDDVIKPGESIRFDTYLIDISEDQESHTPDSSVQTGNCTNTERMEKIDRQQTSLDTDTYVALGKHGQPSRMPLHRQDAGLNSHFAVIEEIKSNKTGPSSVKPLCDGQPWSMPCLWRDAGLNSHFAVIEEIKSNKTVPTVKPLRDGQPSSVPCLRPDAGLNSHFAVIEEIKSNKTVPSVKPLRDGQPSSVPCLWRDAGLNSHFAVIEEIKSNKTVPLVKPLRDANQILSFLQAPKHPECYATGGRSPNRSDKKIMDMELTKTTKSPETTSINAACGGGSFQFRENVKMIYQPCSDKEAQENISEANFDILISSSGGHSSCLISSEEEKAEEFSHERETFPSFDLGF